MANAIQLFAVFILALSFGYCVYVLAQNIWLNIQFAQRQVTERELFRAQTQEIVNRNRIRREKEEGAWNGYRKFRVSKKVNEAKDICSFYLTPHDGRSVPAFEPGQFLTFQLHIPDQPKPTIRCYSLSDSPHPDQYRVTIKRIPPPRDKPGAPAGLSSGYFHDLVEEGSILDVRAPSGHFFLDCVRQSPVVLIGGGIGLTPLLSMLNYIANSGSHRETWFFYGVRHGEEHAMKERLQRVAEEHENIKIVIVYSDPRKGEDVEGRDYSYSGHVGVALFKKLLPSNNYDFYFCGPPPMMNALFGGLREWGVPEEHIHYEAFGPATVTKKKEADKAAHIAPAAATEAATAIQVTFSRSGKTVAWAADAGSLLDFAEANGIAIDSGCRAGNCGTCKTALNAGDVEYLSEPGEMPDAGSCLTCISVPKNSVTLDA